MLTIPPVSFWYAGGRKCTPISGLSHYSNNHTINPPYHGSKKSDSFSVTEVTTFLPDRHGTKVITTKHVVELSWTGLVTCANKVHAQT